MTNTPDLPPYVKRELNRYIKVLSPYIGPVTWRTGKVSNDSQRITAECGQLDITFTLHGPWKEIREVSITLWLDEIVMATSIRYMNLKQFLRNLDNTLDTLEADGYTR